MQKYIIYDKLVECKTALMLWCLILTWSDHILYCTVLVRVIVGFIELLKVVLMVGFFQPMNHFKAIKPFHWCYKTGYEVISKQFKNLLQIFCTFIRRYFLGNLSLNVSLRGIINLNHPGNDRVLKKFQRNFWSEEKLQRKRKLRFSVMRPFFPFLIAFFCI